MYDMSDYDERFQRHARKTAAVDRQGWLKPQRTRRPIRAGVARVLVLLATRIAPTSAHAAPATTALAESHSA